MEDKNKSINEHLISYISYYNNLKTPKYAVLVKGEWGVGKTHLLNEILKDDQKFYVSLFGLTSVQEVHAALFVKMYPTRSWFRKILNWLGNSSIKANDITLALGPLIGNIANALIKEKVDNSKIIVFDDLERCRVNLEDLFGVINKYVEYHNCRGIVIAHDDKLSEELTEKKEKIFGQVIKVYPDTETAFKHFIQNSNMPNAFESIKDIIYSSFLASECKSLRVLSYIINDCARLLASTPSFLIKDKNLLSELFILFTSLNIYYRLGILKEEDIKTRNTALYYVHKDKEKKDAFDIMKETYKKNAVKLNLESDTLNNEVLIEMLVNGLYNKDNIIESINQSRHFNKIDIKAPWYTIWNFHSTETSKVDEALEELYAKFENLEVIEKGEILHSVNLLFMLSEAKHIQKSFDDVFHFYLEYTRRLQENNKFPPADLFTTYEPFGDTAYGYGYWIKDSYRHLSVKLNDIFVKHQYIALRKKYPSFLIEIKNNLKENPYQFCNQISRNGSREKNKFGYIDILSSFKPHEFVDAWLNLDIKRWNEVREALVNRYDAGALQNDLKNEGPWLKKVKMNIRYRANKESGIDRLRISRLIMKL